MAGPLTGMKVIEMVGLTDEYQGSHYAKHLVMISHQFGDDDHHLQAFVHLMDVA